MNNADFWVLVDGKLKYKQTQVKEQGKAGLIDIELSDADRFSDTCDDGWRRSGRAAFSWQDYLNNQW